MNPLITSPANPLVKQARALRQKKAREESGLFLVEGLLHVGEAAEAGWHIETLLYCPERLRAASARRWWNDWPGAECRCAALWGGGF